MIRSVNELLVPIGASIISLIGMCILIIFRINNGYLATMVILFPIFSTILYLLYEIFFKRKDQEKNNENNQYQRLTSNENK